MWFAVGVTLVLSAAAWLALGPLSGTGNLSLKEMLGEMAVGSVSFTCRQVTTVKFDEQTTHEKGQAAVRSCEKNGSQPGSEHWSDVTESGSKGTAHLSSKGHFFRGQILLVGFQKDGNQWKFNEIVGFAEFNRNKFSETLAELASKGVGEAPLHRIQCVVEALATASQTDIIRYLFRPSSGKQDELDERCGFHGGLESTLA